MSRLSFFTVEKIGPKQSMTPEGFLLCEEVPIARVGMMIYGPDETPIKAGPEGLVKIFREAEDVFRAETMASANGKSVTNDHPDEDVVPETWQQLTHGMAMNVRRGEGAKDDLLLADLLITTPEGIEAIQSGKREVSCGYDADYEETGPGTGKQTNIIINHIALVENGRCGPRCAVGDRQTIKPKEQSMAKKKTGKFVDALMRAFKAKDADEVERIADEMAEEGTADEAGEGSGTHIHIHGGAATPGEPVLDEDPVAGRTTFTDDQIQEHIDRNEAEHAEMRSRIEALEKLVNELSGGQGTGDDAEEMKEQILDEVPEDVREQAAKAKDSAFLAESFQDTVAMAEILVPGIRIPTFDGAAKPGFTFKKICGFRRQALDLAYAQPDTRPLLDDLLSGKTLDTRSMSCDAVRTLFRSATAMKRSLNNSGGSHRAKDAQTGAPKGPMTLAELNRMNAERYGKQ